jgi:hypothetical protein
MSEDAGRDTKAGTRRSETDRQERLAQALRDNLKRRKAQMRSRTAGDEPGSAREDQDETAPRG